MNIQVAEKFILRAIRRIKAEYLFDEDLHEKKIDQILQLERVFAYELYYQLSKIVDGYKSKLKDEYHLDHKIRVNGEISKYIWDKVTYPDLVIHGGQNNTENQLIVCEIKRFNKNYPSSELLISDFYKLYEYLNLEIGGKRENFQKALFIALNSDVIRLKKTIKNLLKDIECIKSFMNELLDTIQSKGELNKLLKNKILNNFIILKKKLLKKENKKDFEPYIKDYIEKINKINLLFNKYSKKVLCVCVTTAPAIERKGKMYVNVEVISLNKIKKELKVNSS